MSGPEINTGDLVVYVDADQIQWGPWEVLHASTAAVTVTIDGWLKYPIKASAVHKVTEIPPSAPRT